MEECRGRSIQFPSKSDYEFERGHFLATFDPAKVFDANFYFFSELPKAHLAIFASCTEELALNTTLQLNV